MKTMILADFQICISAPLNIIHSCSNNKKGAHYDLQKLEKAMKRSQELYALSFVVP